MSFTPELEVAGLRDWEVGYLYRRGPRGGCRLTLMAHLPYKTLVVVVALLLPGVGSGVLLETVAWFVIIVVLGVPGLTTAANLIARAVPDAKKVVVQTVLPVPPGGGVVQLKAAFAVGDGRWRRPAQGR